MTADENAAPPAPPAKRRHIWKGVRRPLRHSKAAAERVLDGIRKGETLREIAAQPGRPTMATLDRWLRENDEFRALYESSRRFRCEVLADDVASAAEAGKGDELAAKKFRFEVLKWDVDARSQAAIESGSPRRGR